MDHSKRKFLKGAGAVAATMVLPMQFSVRSAHAAGEATGAKKIVVLTLNGGNDGLNLAIPTSGLNPDGTVVPDSQFDIYQNYRPQIQIPAADILPFGADSSGIDFGLHPSMSALMPNFDKLAVFPATHSSVGTFNANRSHFYQMNLFASGFHEAPPISQDGKGWMGRYLDNRYAPVALDSIVAQDFTGGSQGNLRGGTFVLDLKNPSSVSLGTSNSTAIWNDVKAVTQDDPASYSGRYSAGQTILFDTVLAKLKSDVKFNRAASAVYPEGFLGDSFKRAADMLIGLPELEIIHLAHGGYDTHKDQITNDPDAGTFDPLSGKQAGLLKNWADTIAAFYDDLSVVDPTLLSNVIVVVQTEFGRTVKQNGNFGTDHGNASCWMVFGDSVQGGVYGSYPGLETANLNGGNWLRPTIDYRDIYSELVGPSFLGYSGSNSIFPGYSGPINPLGFIV